MRVAHPTIPTDATSTRRLRRALGTSGVDWGMRRRFLRRRIPQRYRTNTMPASGRLGICRASQRSAASPGPHSERHRRVVPGRLPRQVVGPTERGPRRKVRCLNAPGLSTGLADHKFVEGVLRTERFENGLYGRQARRLELCEVDVAGGAEVGGLLHRKKRHAPSAAKGPLARNERQDGLRAVIRSDRGKDVHGTEGFVCGIRNDARSGPRSTVTTRVPHPPTPLHVPSPPWAYTTSRQRALRDDPPGRHWTSPLTPSGRQAQRETPAVARNGAGSHCSARTLHTGRAPSMPAGLEDGEALRARRRLSGSDRCPE